MPSFDMYKKMNGGVRTNGQARKINSDMIMEATFTEGLAYRRAYIYDYYHDDEPLVYRGVNPERSLTKFPIDIKYIVNSYNSENKDIVGYHIQFRPSFDWKKENKLAYYKEVFEDKYDAEFPIGMYLDIWDDDAKLYRKWLVTEPANNLGLQFPTWYILPVDHVFQWIHKDKKYQMCGIYRSQSSYNSGEWINYRTATVENQRKCILPMNDISTTIFYNKRIILSAPIETPITWHCSKVEQTAPKGTNRITFVQEQWDEHKDSFEYEIVDSKTGNITSEFSSNYDSSKKIIGMWADYNISSVPPTDYEPILPKPTIYSTISYSGTKPEIKSGGSYKKFTVNFFESDGTEIDFQQGEWFFATYSNDDKLYEDASDLVNVLYPDDSDDVAENQIKVKFKRDDTYIGKVLVIKYVSDFGIESSVEMNITSL